jgi:ERF superfamily
MKTSPTIKEISAALVAFSKAIENPVADQTARVNPKDTNKAAYTYPYADLAGVTNLARPILAGVGIAVLQEVVEKGNGDIGAATTLLHASGEWMRFAPVWIPGGETAKEAGAAISYSRRYGLLAALGLAAREPEDGNSARRSPPAAAPQPQFSPPATPDAMAGLDRLLRSRGKTMDGDVRRMANARQYRGPLEQIPGNVLESIMNKISELPIVADGVTGEVTPPANADAQARRDEQAELAP